MARRLSAYDGYLADFQALERSQPAQGPTWVRQLRQQALARFVELGFPTARQGNERWKYTNVAPIADSTFAYPLDLHRNGVQAADLRQLAPWDESWSRLVFLNGHYAETLSTAAAGADGVRVVSLAQALSEEGELAARHLAQHAKVEEDSFIALNTAFLQDGAFVYLPEGAALPSPLHLIFVSTEGGQPTVSHPRTIVLVGRHSKLTLIESYVSLGKARHFTNAVAEMVLDEGAQVEHYRLLMESSEAFHVGVTRVYQGQDSTFTSTSFAKGAALGRNDLLVLLDGPGSACYLNGLYQTSDRQHIDNYINIDHAKPHTTSRLYYKGILDGNSRAIFGGIVLVRPGAIKANAMQKDKNLLLSAGAEADSKPSLLIYADDVKCGHGATAGHLDENILFYMRSRGLDLETASRLLVHGFANEILDTVPLEPLRAYLDQLFLGSLPSFTFRFGEAS